MELSDPRVLVLLACGVFAVGCWIVSLLTGNYSQTDRLWSITPPVYVAVFAGATGFSDPRLNLMLLLTALWGARLTWNFARKGGYRAGHEDYRWPVLRQKMHPAVFQVFNVVFIAGYQHVLVLLMALPAWTAWESRGTPLGLADALAAGLFALFLVGESVADQQQWNFQTAKHAARQIGEPVEAEFITTGLFRFSRHPNFFCEQAIWWSFYGFAVAASGQWLHPTLAGAFLLTLLFQGSTWFTEKLTLAKYPEYAAYKRTTSRLLPLPPRRG